jgi:hypothetical protein
MTHANDTIRVLIPLTVRRKNGRPKVLPPANYRPSEDQTQDAHVLRAIGRAAARTPCNPHGTRKREHQHRRGILRSALQNRSPPE